MFNTVNVNIVMTNVNKIVDNNVDTAGKTDKWGSPPS